MSNKPQPPVGNDNTGAKRAAEFSDAMHHMPGYSDDTMFFCVRYVTTVRDTLRQCDYETFMHKSMEANQKYAMANCDCASGAPTDQGEQQSFEEKAAELRAEAAAIISEFPDLVRDFDRYNAATQLMIKNTRGNKK